MALLIPFFFVLVLAVVANLAAADDNEATTRLFDLVLALLNLPLLLAGLLFIALPLSLEPLVGPMEAPMPDLPALGQVLTGMAVWGFLAAVRPLRRQLARLLPIDAGSPVHTLALVLAGYLVGNTAMALTQDVLVELAASPIAVTAADVLLQQVAFVALAFVGAGFAIRRDWPGLRRRLGLERPTARQLLLGTAAIMLLIFLQGIIGGLWMLADPEQAELLGSLNESLLADFDTVGEWLLLAIAAGIGEEILFRGALQPIFGIVATSVLFSVVHIQYGLTPITLAVFLLSLILGWLRWRTNTSVAIFVHFGYNFMLGLFSMLAVYAERFVG